MTGKVCNTHLTELADHLKHYGIWHLVNTDPKRSIAFAENWLMGTTAIDEFDPQVVAILEIRKKLAQMMPPALLAGDVCPLCEFNVWQKNPIAAYKAIKDVSKLMYLRVEVMKGKRQPS